MFGIGTTELLVALVLALLVLGPEKLVRFARTAGKMMRRMRDMSGELTRSITDAVAEEEEKPSASESPDEQTKKKKVSPLQTITDEIKQALTLEEEKPAASTSDSPGGEGAAPATESPAKKGEEIADSLRKMRQEISEALSEKKPPSGDSPGEKDE